MILLLICHCGMLVSHNTNRVATYKGNNTLVLMHSGILNGCQLLCNTHTVPEQHRGNAALFLYFTHYRPFISVC